MLSPPIVTISAEMMAEAEHYAERTRVHRTQASPHDILVGNLGELAFAQFFYGTFRSHRLGKSKGETDFPDIEIKTSAYPFRNWLNLKVRKEYAEARQPAFYVQEIIDVPDPKARPDEGMRIYVCGFCSANELKATGRLLLQKNKNGKYAGYHCWEVPILQLHPMTEFRGAYAKIAAIS